VIAAAKPFTFPSLSSRVSHLTSTDYFFPLPHPLLGNPLSAL
jgi:hypothetical protein